MPRVQATVGAAWQPARGPRASVQVRYVDQQFEDDAGTLSLGGFAVADVALGWRFDDRWELFFHIENALDRIYQVARTSDGLATAGPHYWRTAACGRASAGCCAPQKVACRRVRACQSHGTIEGMGVHPIWLLRRRVHVETSRRLAGTPAAHPGWRLFESPPVR